MGDDEYTDLLGGAVGEIAREEIPRIVANLVTDREEELELWIRPERTGVGYMVEWTTLEYDADEQGWRPATSHTSAGTDWVGAVTQAARQLLNHTIAFCRARMPSFDVDREQITVFVIDDTYQFKQYFDEDDLFGKLRRYYNEADYRFEVPADAFDDVQDLLEAHFYDPVVVDDPAEFCVVYPRYADHPDVLFKASVLQRSEGDQHVFLMKDQLSVEQAVNSGAERLGNSDVDFTL